MGEKLSGVESRQIPDHVVRSAATLFRKNGYAAATTRNLAAELGIQKASLYYYITGKEDLLYEICVRSLRDIRERTVAAYADGEPGRPALRRAIAAHVDALFSDRDMHATMLQNMAALSDARHDVVSEMRRDYELFFRNAVEQAFGSTDSDGVPPDLRTLYILGAMNWSVFWYSPKSQDGLDSTAIGETIAASFGV